MSKRICDIAVALPGVLFLLPGFLLIALAIKLESKGPVFYRGVRAGRFGTPFRIFKFRTMVQNADQIGGSSTPGDDPRVTRMGRWLRKGKLDELPQLLNVLRGEMSLVGPRPQVPWAVERYSEEERAVLTLRPGVTDYASLRFRNEAEILRGSAHPDEDYFRKIHPEKMRLSLLYVKHHSVLLDCRILATTILTLVRPVGRRIPAETAACSTTSQVTPR